MSEKVKKEIIEWVKVIVVASALTFAITSFVRPTLVIGESMTNTFQEYDYLISYKRAYKSKLPEYGDVVLFQSHLPIENGSPAGMFNKEKVLIKRVIGLPGDTILVQDGKVYRNNEELIEPYIRDGYTDHDMFVEVPEGHVFAMGENRLGSRDSRDPSVGPVPEEMILGKIVIRLYPFNKITTDFDGVD